MIGTLPVVGLHQQEHETYVEGCDLCRWSSVAIAPSAMPSRTGGAEAARINAKEKEWARDMRAYRSIRKNGVQPPQIDGAHRLEGATDKLEVEAGTVFKDAAERKQARDGIVRYEEMKAAGQA